MSDLRLSDIHLRDPFITETDTGQFVLFGTTDENIWGGPATGFDCYTSHDLVSWQGPIEAFRPPADFWSESQFWAPEVYHRGGRWYLIATFRRAVAGVRGIGILAADSPTGPYTPWSDGPVTPPQVSSIDGTLFVDQSDVPWLVYSRGAELGPEQLDDPADGQMLALRLTSDLRAADGQPHVLFKASDAEWSRPLRFAENGPKAADLGLADDPLLTDGPFLVRDEAGTLLMLWSSFGDHGYAIGLARSESGDVLGPWVQDPELVWPRDGGHGMLLRTNAGQDHLVLHTPNETPLERATLIPVEISAGRIRVVS